MPALPLDTHYVYKLRLLYFLSTCKKTAAKILQQPQNSIKLEVCQISSSSL